MARATPPSEWLALLHQLPTSPPYLRTKIWRRLQAVGAVAIKNAVHVLPRTAEHERTFEELLAEIIDKGGEAILIEARLLSGMADADVRSLFDAARDADYEDITQRARKLMETGPANGNDIARLQKRFADVEALDHFGASARSDAQAALAELDRQRYQHPDISRAEPLAQRPLDLQSKVWVTRSGVHVDRIACAWLIRRFIDPNAAFKFVAARSYIAGPNELRFDMSDAEFTHEGDRCSFETLIVGADLTGDPGLMGIAEMIHDLDFGDGRFGHPETPGLAALFSSICASHDDDLLRIAAASDVLNQFHTHFSTKKNIE
jgi:hypothetical protein